MDMPLYLHRLFAYDDWANRETLRSLKVTGAPPQSSIRLLAHIIAAEWLWLGRLKQDLKPVVVWPELTLDQCEAQIAELSPVWQGYLAELTPAGLSTRIPYINSKGENWSNTVEDMLVHVVLHSAHHRGQVAADLRASGHTPAYTDFIHCIRQGWIA